MNRITIHMDRHDIPDASVQRVMYRFLRDVSDPFRMEESIFKKYFRLSRIAALELIGWLHSEVELKRTSGIPAHLLILATVRFLAEGSLHFQIADSKLRIMSMCVSPGSNTDQFIWNSSQIKHDLEILRNNPNVERRYYLLGDNGYGTSPIILTPIIDAVDGTPEALYTQEHCQTRCKVEQTFGMLTQVWWALRKARRLQYSPEKATKIIFAAAILHNYRLTYGITEELQDIQNNHVVVVNGNDGQAVHERNRLINLYYQQHERYW